MAQNYSSEGLERLLVQVRRIAEHREAAANKAIKKAYKDLAENLNGWLGNEYAKYADDDALTFDVLRAKGEYARFLDEVQVKIDDIYPEVKDTVQTLIDATYAACWEGMCDAVVKFDRVEDLKERLSPIKAITPEQVKAAVENPIPKLRLSPILERNRKQIISNIKREIGVGLTNGDRMATMARRISKCVNGDYNKAMLIARTEGHRVREKGFDDSAARIDRIMQDSGSAYRMVKIWKTMRDMSVRHTNLANHVDMEGQTVLADEDFTLTQSGAKAKCPGTSGIAAEDCNCRCRVTHRIMSDAEFFKATGRHFDKKAVDISGESGIIESEQGIFNKQSERLTERYAHANLQDNGKTGQRFDSKEIADSTGVVEKTSDSESKIARAIKAQPWASTVYEDGLDAVLNVLDNADDTAKKFWLKYGDLVDGDFYSSSGEAYYSPAEKKVHLNINLTSDECKRLGESKDTPTFFHETGHFFDDNVLENGDKIQNHLPELKTKLEEDALDYVNGIRAKVTPKLEEYKSLKRLNRKVTRAVKNDLHTDPDMKGAVSDVFSGLTNRKLEGTYCHDKSYWKDPGAVIDEAIAHMFECTAMGGERLTTFRKYFPNAYDYFLQYIKTLI